jgi:uncharacterized membrane protein YhaH (DUF805 family)
MKKPRRSRAAASRTAMSTRGIDPTGTACIILAFLCLTGVPGRAAVDDDQVIPLLKTRIGTYTNVTITSRTAKELCILHAGGAGNVFLQDLDPEAQELVGYSPPVPAGEAFRALANERIWAFMKSVPFDVQALDGGTHGSDPATTIELSPGAMVFLVGLIFVVYLFTCYGLKLICTKAGHDPGLMIWVPLLQVFPMLRAAGMSGWWVLGMLVPVFNLVVTILWSFRIVSARGKSAVWAVLLILPFTNLIAFLYLAFSGGGNHEEEGPPRVPAFAIRPV